MQTVRKGDFLAVVARNEWAAIKAARAMRVTWTAGTRLPDQASVFDDWRKLPVAKEEITQNVGDAQGRARTSARRVKATYDFAVQTHATIGPSCAVADFKDGKLTVWTSSQATHSMQHELAVDHRPATRSDPPRIHRRRGLLRPQRHRGRRRGRVADLACDRPAGARAMVAGRRDRALAEEPAAHAWTWRRASTRKATWWRGRATSTSRSTISSRSSRSTSRCSRRRETGIPRPGNWVGFLFQNSGQPYQFPNVRVNTKHIAEAFFRSSHLRSPGGSRTASPTRRSWTSSRRRRTPIRRSSACGTSRTSARSTSLRRR